MKAYTEEEKEFKKQGRENARKLENKYHFTKMSKHEFMDFVEDTCIKRSLLLANNWNKTEEEDAEFNLLLWTQEAMQKIYKAATK